MTYCGLAFYDTTATYTSCLLLLESWAWRHKSLHAHSVVAVMPVLSIWTLMAHTQNMVSMSLYFQFHHTVLHIPHIHSGVLHTPNNPYCWLLHCDTVLRYEHSCIWKNAMSPSSRCLLDCNFITKKTKIWIWWYALVKYYKIHMHFK
jgi:hypothetical protein